jgi:hypothetical protein
MSSALVEEFHRNLACLVGPRRKLVEDAYVRRANGQQNEVLRPQLRLVSLRKIQSWFSETKSRVYPSYRFIHALLLSTSHSCHARSYLERASSTLLDYIMRCPQKVDFPQHASYLWVRTKDCTMLDNSVYQLFPIAVVTILSSKCMSRRSTNRPAV